LIHIYEIMIIKYFIQLNKMNKNFLFHRSTRFWSKAKKVQQFTFS